MTTTKEIRVEHPWLVYSDALEEARRIYFAAQVEPQRVYDGTMAYAREAQELAMAEPQRVYNKALAAATRVYDKWLVDSRQAVYDTEGKAKYKGDA